MGWSFLLGSLFMCETFQIVCPFVGYQIPVMDQPLGFKLYGMFLVMAGLVMRWNMVSMWGRDILFVF